MKTRTLLLLFVLLTAGQRAWAQASGSLTFVTKNNWTSLCIVGTDPAIHV